MARPGTSPSHYGVERAWSAGRPPGIAARLAGSGSKEAAGRWRARRAPPRHAGRAQRLPRCLPLRSGLALSALRDLPSGARQRTTEREVLPYRACYRQYVTITAQSVARPICRDESSTRLAGLGADKPVRLSAAPAGQDRLRQRLRDNYEDFVLITRAFVPPPYTCSPSDTIRRLYVKGDRRDSSRPFFRALHWLVGNGGRLWLSQAG